MVFMGMMFFIFGVLSLGLNRYHFLSFLLSLELAMLGIFLSFSNIIFMGGLEIIIMYMVFAVSEASLGLGVLVLSVLFYGGDYVNGYNCLSC